MQEVQYERLYVSATIRPCEYFHALVGLNGLESIHMDMAKSAVIRAIAMAQSLERFLSEDETAEQL